MSKPGLLLFLSWGLPCYGWGQIRTQGRVRLAADQARIEAGLEDALRTGRLSANPVVWAALVYAQAERPLRAEDSARVASVRARGYFLDRTSVKTYCLFLPQPAEFYLVRHVVGGLGIISVRSAEAASPPQAALTTRQIRQRNRKQIEQLQQYLLKDRRLQL